jgi:hypothetical protein
MMTQQHFKKSNDEEKRIQSTSAEKKDGGETAKKGRNFLLIKPIPFPAKRSNFTILFLKAIIMMMMMMMRFFVASCRKFSNSYSSGLTLTLKFKLGCGPITKAQW